MCIAVIALNLIQLDCFSNETIEIANATIPYAEGTIITEIAVPLGLVMLNCIIDSCVKSSQKTER
jgi:hypothetical protein